MEKRFELFEKVIETLNRNKVLDSIILVGSWCQYAYKIYFNNVPHIPALRTMDIDFLIPQPPKIKNNVDVDAILEQIGFSKQFSYQTGNIKYVHPELEIDFLTPKLSRGTDKPYLVRQLHINAQQLRYLKLLQEHVIKVKINKNDVYVPEPAAYVLHKLIIYKKRTDSAKKQKDIKSAIEIGEFLLTVKQEREKLIFIYNELPKSWQLEIKKSLKTYSGKIYDLLINNN